MDTNMACYVFIESSKINGEFNHNWKFSFGCIQDGPQRLAHIFVPRGTFKNFFYNFVLTLSGNQLQVEVVKTL